MFESKIKIIDELKQFVDLISNYSEARAKFCATTKDFTRKRKLTFDRLVLFISKLCKKTLSFELEDFFHEFDAELNCTPSGFTQQRKKLLPEFFQAWNEVLLLSFMQNCPDQIQRWYGYRLIAGDGSNVSLINTRALSEHFGGQRNQECSFVQAKIFYFYDVLNELVIYSKMGPYRTGELSMAYPTIKNLEKDMLMIYDRNFYNYRMMALHLWQQPKIKFVIRAKEIYSEIREFIQSNKKSEIVTLTPTSHAIKGLTMDGFNIDRSTAIQVRLIRVELENCVEVLATNLFELPECEFKDLYFKRWKIETNISVQKNILQLESFSGITVHSVLQDFYATIFMTNLHSILIKEAQQTLDESPVKRKYHVKINKNKSMGKLKINLILLFIDEHPEIILQTLHDYFIRDKVPIRPGRSFPRKVKNKQSKSKHKTYSNFKLAC